MTGAIHQYWLHQYWWLCVSDPSGTHEAGIWFRPLGRYALPSTHTHIRHQNDQDLSRTPVIWKEIFVILAATLSICVLHPSMETLTTLLLMKHLISYSFYHFPPHSIPLLHCKHLTNYYHFMVILNTHHTIPYISCVALGFIVWCSATQFDWLIERNAVSWTEKWKWTPPPSTNWRWGPKN